MKRHIDSGYLRTGRCGERIFGWKRDEVTDVGRKYIMRSFITCTLLKV
jgi:hypothetical protein